LDRAQERFAVADLRLVLIGQATPRQAAHFRKRQQIELTVLADEQRASYKAAGTKVGGVIDLLGPKVFAKGLATMARSGKMQGRTVGNPAQLGGAAVIGPGDQVIWSRMARDASDNASPDEILRAAGAAASGV
jgi:AhpC/TSA antioxidant enzyme